MTDPMHRILADAARELLAEPPTYGPGVVVFIDDAGEHYEAPKGQPEPAVIVFMPREGR